MIKTIEYIDGVVRMIDQTRLPLEKEYIDCRTVEEVGHAIKTMVIRGAPAIGVAAAMGVSLGADSIEASTFEGFYQELEEKCDTLGESRPTAVNLAWAIKRMKNVAQINKSLSIIELKSRLKEEALTILTEDIATNEAMGQHGQTLVADGNVILTHCNAGALATAGFGTALGVVRASVNAGKKIRVLANETRPFLQGARLTTWELNEDNIPVKLITDNMCGFFMNKKEIDVVTQLGDYFLVILEEEDYANAYLWYSVASALNIEGAIEERDKVERRLDSDTLVKMQTEAKKQFEIFNTIESELDENVKENRTEKEYES